MKTGSMQFGRVPYAVIDGGAVARMKPADAKLYLVIAAHVNKHWQARPSIERLAEKSGLRMRSVCRAVKRLETAGLIAVVRGGGSGRSNVYTLSQNIDSRVRDRGGETLTPEARNSGTGGRETLTPVSKNTDARVRRTELNRIEQRRTGRAPGSGEVGENRNEIIERLYMASSQTERKS